MVARRPVLFLLTDQPLLRNRPTADSGPVRAFVSRNACAATKSPALSGNENESQLSFYRFWCLVFHKTKKVKMEVGSTFSVFCVCSFKNQETIKGKSISVFPFYVFVCKTEAEFRFRFLCLFVHKRKNDKTEAEFRFSFFVFLLSKKQKTIKRKSNFVYLFLEKDSIKQ